MEERRARLRVTRRGFLAGMGALAAAGALLPRKAWAAPQVANIHVGIVGAGIAGLACARKLKAAGVACTLYEGSDHTGGRIKSLGGAGFPGASLFPGQTAEAGAEFIDNLHTVMKGWAQEFNIPLEDYSKEPGEDIFYIDGAHVAEEDFIDEYRDFHEAMIDDLQTLSPPTAEDHTPADVVLDYMTLAEYLDSRGAGPIMKGVIDVAYTGEYGLEIDELSSLGWLLFVHADRRSKFLPFGVFSDERYHATSGNQQIPDALRNLVADKLQLGKKLVHAARTPAGKIALTFSSGGGASTTVVHDAVVFATSFKVLRDVQLDASLALPAFKLNIINNLDYGTNAKHMLSFASRAPWTSIGSKGSVFSRSLNAPNVQQVFETNWTLATPGSAVITDYSGGDRGAAINPNARVQEANAFLGDVNTIIPGMQAAARKDAQNKPISHLEHWPSNEFTKGAYTANQPGYFTTMADLEQSSVGNIYFCNESCSSFYVWQGFMEGAAGSGLEAAGQILKDLKVGNY